MEIEENREIKLKNDNNKDTENILIHFFNHNFFWNVLS